MIKIIAVLCIAVMVLADYDGYSDNNQHEEHIDYYSPPHYNYEYSVHDPRTHDFKSQHETRVGDTVKGYYTLKEADGTTREVHYTSDDKNGFNAEVKRTGQAYHPQVYNRYHGSESASQEYKY
nr:adult-specific cuticular protein ACP-20-like [Halyomorpha halys]